MAERKQRKHSENRQRQYIAPVRLSPAERELLKAEAERTGKKPAAILREAFLASLAAREGDHA